MSCCLSVAFVTLAKKKSKQNIKLLEAYAQRIIPGIPGARPQTEFHFVVVWQDTKYPEAFFWRGDNGWMTCNIMKAHKAAKDIHSNIAADYTLEPIINGKIKQGDTLDLRPVPGGKFPVPQEIPPKTKNTLYYRTGSSAWLACPVKNISKKPDKAMP